MCEGWGGEDRAGVRHVERRQAFGRHDGVTSPYRKMSSPAFRAALALAPDPVDDGRSAGFDLDRLAAQLVDALQDVGGS